LCPPTGTTFVAMDGAFAVAALARLTTHDRPLSLAWADTRGSTSLLTSLWSAQEVEVRRC